MAKTKDNKPPVMVTAMPKRVRFAFADGEAEDNHKARRPTPITIARNWRPSTSGREE